MTDMEYLKLSECAYFSALRTNEISIENYVTTENMLPNKGGVVLASSLPNVSSTSKYEKDDILLSNIRPYFKKIWLADKAGSCSNDVLVVKCNEKYLPRFLYYVLSDNNYFNYATVTSKGTKMPRGTPKAIMKYWVPNVSRDLQNRIADILSKYDTAIDNNNKRIKVLEQMAENLYKEWFVRFRFPGYENVEFIDDLPCEWEVKRLGEFGISLDTGSRPSGGVDDSLTEGVPSLGAEAVKGLAEFDYSSVKYIPHEYYGKMKRGKFDGNAILVYKDGAYIGKTTIFRNEFPFKTFAANEHVFLMKANNFVYQNYLYFTLHQKEYFYLMQNLNRNAAQPGLAQLDIKRIKITVPTEKVVRQFNAIIEPIFDEVFQLAKANRNIAQQRDMLLPRLMSGKLKV